MLSAGDWTRLRSRVRVALDRKTVISSATLPYPSSIAAVTVGTNTIGGSSADATFSGTASITRPPGWNPLDCIVVRLQIRAAWGQGGLTCPP